MPLGNRAARFRKRQVELVLSNLEAQWRDSIEQVKKDVLDAAQDLSVSQKKMFRQQEIFDSTTERLNYLSLRKNELPKKTDVLGLQLTQLVQVQAAVARSKSSYAAALAERGRAVINMNRATGILVQPTSTSLQDPGQHQFVKIYRQSIEGKRRHRQFANATTGNTWIISKQLPKYDRNGPTRQPAPQPEVLVSGELERVDTQHHLAHRQASQTFKEVVKRETSDSRYSNSRESTTYSSRIKRR